jgi:hypothetical protein
MGLSAFCMDLVTFESTSVVALSELPLQAMPLIAKVEGRPTGKISALYGSKKPLALE